MNQVQREIEIQSHLKYIYCMLYNNFRHPNIVRMYSYFYDTKRIYLVLEYVPRGELSKDITRFGRFGDNRAATYVYQLSKALSYCHQNDVIHRDIKPENILLGTRGEVKIADFGSAVHLPASRRMTTFGTLNYLAPEMFHLECVHDHRVDIWSLGILTFEMLTGYLPFDGKNYQEISEKIQTADVLYPDVLDLGAIKLITNMLKKLSSQRVSLSEIDNYDWIKMHAEFSISQCTAALQDWENASNQNSICPSSSSYDCSSTFVNTFLND
ncbi:Aurora kinase A [Schistosoma japonicum]|nr:Aurora kinase A [Schistosoma japonicum]